MRTELDHALQNLLDGLGSEADIALRALAEAADIVDRGRREGEEPLSGVDVDIAARFTALEREAEVLIARQAPVASDLRHVLSLLRINHHIERIGHHGVRIARSTHEPTAAPDPSMTAALLGAMADRTLEIATRAIDAMRMHDHDAAEGLRELDVEIDTLEGAVAEAAMEEFHDTEMGRDRVLWALAVARRLERIGDHAVGIGVRARDLPARHGPGGAGR